MNMVLRNEVASEVWSDNLQINWSRVFNKDDVAFSYISKPKPLLLKNHFKSYSLENNNTFCKIPRQHCCALYRVACQIIRTPSFPPAKVF